MFFNQRMILASIFFMMLTTSMAYGEEAENIIETPTFEAVLIQYIGYILSPIAAIGGLLLQRYIERNDIAKQEKIQHLHWLWQRFNTLAEEYYFPLAKFSADIGRGIDRSTKSQDERIIKITYYHVKIFLTKYAEFKKNTGANFLFKGIGDRKGRDYEIAAIRKHREIMTILPFDELDINEIQNIVETPTAVFTENAYKYFTQWITSEYCTRSQKLILEKLDCFHTILGIGSEKISHPESFDKRETNKDLEKCLEASKNSLEVTSLTPKYVRIGDLISIFGKGFTTSGVRFYAGEKVVDSIIVNDELVFLRIKGIVLGTHDIYAKISGEMASDVKETIAIPVHVGSRMPIRNI